VTAAVTSVVSTVAVLEQRGVTVAFVEDPGGNIIELLQR